MARAQFNVGVTYAKGQAVPGTWCKHTSGSA